MLNDVDIIRVGGAGRAVRRSTEQPRLTVRPKAA